MSRFLLVVVVVSLVTVARCSVLLLVKLFPEETKRRHKTRFPFLLYLPRSSSWQFVLFLPVRLLPPTPSRSSVLLPPLYLSLHLPLPSSPLLHFLPPFLLFLSFSSPSFLSFSLPFSLFLSLPFSFLSSGFLFLSIRIYLSECSFSPFAMDTSLDTSACAAPRVSFSPWGREERCRFSLGGMCSLSLWPGRDNATREPSWITTISVYLSGRKERVIRVLSS